MQKKREFVQGAACALAIVNRNHDEPTMCAEALVAIGPSTADALREAGVDEYDIEGLGSALQHLELRRARDREATDKRNRSASEGAMAAHCGITTAK